MAEVFVSYTNDDRKWAEWIARELQRLGHKPLVHDWEIGAGGNILKWMEESHDRADHVLLVISAAYLTKDYSSWERHAAQWAAASGRPNFAWPVFVEPCAAPSLLALLKRCDLFGLDEADARTRLAAYLAQAGQPAGPALFPGRAGGPLDAEPPAGRVSFPGRISNIPIRVPRHFVGRDAALAAIDAALRPRDGGIAALHGLRGVGKTTLAAAYAERQMADYRAAWWIRAQTPETVRSDLVSLGVRLGWVAAEQKDELALAEVLQRLRSEGEGVLLVYDNAISPQLLMPFVPTGGAWRALITSNAPAWRGVAQPIEIPVWAKTVGGDYLVARTGREGERQAAEALSEDLGGLTLAHEQAGAYCDRLGLSLSEYRSRFAATPARLLDAVRDAPPDYHGGLTVAKAFGLAIAEAARRHPAAEALIGFAATLASEPIPLVLFSKARLAFGEPFASQIADDDLDEAVAALRDFALIEREAIADERNPFIATDVIRMHRLVQAVAAATIPAQARNAMRSRLIAAMVEVFPPNVFSDPRVWPLARRLDAHAFALVGADGPAGDEADESVATLLNMLASYRQGALASYPDARRMFERALAIREKALGETHAATAESLNNLALLLRIQGDLEGALPLCARALAIYEMTVGPDDPDTAMAMETLAAVEKERGDISGSRRLYENALAIRERKLASDPSGVARCLNNLALVMQRQNDLGSARPLLERALAILAGALGPDHLFTHRVRRNLAEVRMAEGFPADALEPAKTALAAYEKACGRDHPSTKDSARTVAAALEALGDAAEAEAVRTGYGVSAPGGPA